MKLSRTSAYNWVKRHEFVAANLQVRDLSDLPLTLIDAAAKSSTPPALKQAVLDGDILE